MKVLILIPDSLSMPMGGMGVQLAGLLRGSAAVCPDVEYLVVGTGGEPVTAPTYRYGPLHFKPVLTGARIYGAAMALLSQVDFLDAGLWYAWEYGPIDVVHAMDFSTAYAGIRLAKRLGVPLVTTFQLSQVMLALDAHVAIGAADQMFLDVVLALETAMCHESAKVIQVSQAYREFWSAVAPDAADRMVVISNGVDDSPGDLPRPAEYGTGYNVLYIGRCCLQKGTHLIVEAIEHGLWPQDVTLYWAGDERGGIPPLWERVQALAQAGKITLLGYLSSDAKWAALQHADAVLMPSTHEPFGIVALEAMACGAPLITTGVTGLGEFCDASNSILIEPSATGIVAGIERARQLDGDERSRLVANAHATAKRFRWPEIAQQLVDVYKSVITHDLHA